MRLTSLCTGLVCAALGWGQGARQSGIAHVAFRVADLEASRAFYNKLGFEQFFEMRQGEKTTEAFLKINDHQFLELYPRTDAAQPLGLMHVCYESADIEALHAEYVKRGLAVSEVRKAGAGNLLMTMKDPEGQTIEYTQYMPGSRHWEDRGKHMGAQRVAVVLMGATSLAVDRAAVWTFYVEKLGFSELGQGTAARLRIPGDSGQEVEIAQARAGAKSGIRFGVSDLKRTAGVLRDLDLAAKTTPASAPGMLTVADPDGALVTFVRAVRPGGAAR